MGPSNVRLQIMLFGNGERYPLLVDGSGMPLWYPTLFATTQLRNASKAPNTITAALAAIRSLLAWAVASGIDLEDRLVQGIYLRDFEIESFRAYSESPWPNSTHARERAEFGVPKSTERFRGQIGKNLRRVAPGTHYNRMTYAADYLEWLAKRLVERDVRKIDAKAIEDIKQMSIAIKIRRPVKSGASLLSARRGLDAGAHELLLRVIKRESSSNPFEKEVRARNEVIVRLLYEFGMRAGELLSLKISDFDFLENTVLIPRRHDDIEDPRKNQPVAKTLDRRLPMSHEIANLVRSYVLGDRHALHDAKRHPFLLVVHQKGPFCGLPLTSKGLAKVFQVIKSVDPIALGSLSPHVLRHTVNDRLSAKFDKEVIRAADEEKMRSYLMGWREGSGTAAIYTRRHVERKAQEAMLSLQKSKTSKHEERDA